MALVAVHALTAEFQNLAMDEGPAMDEGRAHPTPKPKPKPFGVVDGCTREEMSYYVMGYSFLMKEEWRVKTACGLTSMSVDSLTSVVKMLDEHQAFSNDTKHCIHLVRSRHLIPVVARGARRGWYVQRTRVHESKDHPEWDMQALDLSSTTLGAVPDDSAEIYAVIFPLSEQKLHELDSRELRANGYPAWIHMKRLRLLNSHDSIPMCSMVRWYPIKPSLVHPATEVHPIVMSEVDLVVGGAAEIAEKSGVFNFHKNVIRTIYGWSPMWVNDRPRSFAPFDLEAREVIRLLVQVAIENENNNNTAVGTKRGAAPVRKLQAREDEHSIALNVNRAASVRKAPPGEIDAVKTNGAASVGKRPSSPDEVVAVKAASIGSLLVPTDDKKKAERPSPSEEFGAVKGHEASATGNDPLSPELLQRLTLSIMENIGFPNPRAR